MLNADNAFEGGLDLGAGCRVRDGKETGERNCVPSTKLMMKQVNIIGGGQKFALIMKPWGWIFASDCISWKTHLYTLECIYWMATHVFNWLGSSKITQMLWGNVISQLRKWHPVKLLVWVRDLQSEQGFRANSPHRPYFATICAVVLL